MKKVRIDRVKLITCMAEKEMSSRQLAELSGITPSTISNIRSGKTCAFKTAEAIAKALCVPIDLLIREVNVNAV